MSGKRETKMQKPKTKKSKGIPKMIRAIEYASTVKETSVPKKVSRMNKVIFFKVFKAFVMG